MVGKVKLISCVMAILFGLLCGPILGKTVFHVSNFQLTTLGAVMAGVVILYDYILSILLSSARFTWSVIINGTQALIKCIFAIVSYFLITPNSVTVYIWYGLAPVVSVIVGWLSIPAKYKHQLSDPKIWSEIIRVMKFGAIGVLAAAIGDNIDVLMVNAMMSDTETGLYAAASRVALMVTLFGMSFGTVFNTRVASYKNPHDLHMFTRKAFAFGIGSLLLIPLSFLMAQPLILLTAGSQYLAAIPSLNLVMASAFVMMAIMPFIAMFYAIDYPAYFAVAGIIQTIVLLLLNAILIPVYGIEGAGLAKLVTRVVVAFYTVLTALYFAKRQFKIKIPSLQDIWELVHV